mgnify:CR=1 FL=1
MASVLRGDHVYAAESGDRAQGEVIQIADWGRHKVDVTRLRRAPSYGQPSEESFRVSCHGLSCRAANEESIFAAATCGGAGAEATTYSA